MRNAICLALIFACTGLCAQEQANLPYLSQSYGGSATIEPLVAGDELDVCLMFEDVFGRGHASYALSDNLGNTYTVTSLVNYSGSNYIYHGYTHVAFAGTPTFTWAVPPIGALDQRTSLTTAVFKGTSGTLDGSPTSGTASTTNTTTVNGDILSSCSGILGAPNPPSEFVTLQNADPNGANSAQQMQRTGAPGTYTLNTIGGTAGIQTLAFEPSGLVVGTSQMPDGVVSQLYSAQLTAAGGIAAPTFSIATGALPGCLTLAPLTGTISGTCNAGQSVTIGVAATDGTTTSSTQSLSFKIGTPAKTIAVAQTALSPLGPLGGNTGVTLPSVQCGSVIVAGFIGMNSHGVIGWYAPPVGVNNNFTDSFGTVFHHVGPIGGGNQDGIVWYVGQTTQAGNDTVVGSNYAGSGLHYYVMEVTGAQNIVDYATWGNGGFPGGSPVNYSVSYTPAVANMMLLVATNTNNTGDTKSYSPLSVAASAGSITNEVAIGNTSVATTATYTANVSVITTAPSPGPVTSILGLRPAVAIPSCPISVVHHRTDIK